MSAAAEPLLLMGPTACGKSALATALCARLPAEIISVDSCAVYRGMDIGAAKPSAAVRARVRHHLLDIRRPSQSYSAGDFCRDAAAAIREIEARGARPILVGGTMLYFRALTGGLHRFPEVPPAVREKTRSDLAHYGAAAMHRELTRLDPARARQIFRSDSQRIGRALELARAGGGVMSASLRAAKPPSAIDRAVKIALIPQDRKRLHQAVAVRLEEMFARGLIAEVKAVVAECGDGGAAALRAVGYRQVAAHLRGECDEAEARRRALVATRRLAKRQMTWLRAMTDATVVDPFAADAADAVARLIARR